MVINFIDLGGDPRSLRRGHRALALKALFRGNVSRTGLAERLRLSPMAVGRIVRELAEKDLVREAGRLDRLNGPGRRQIILELNPEGIFAAGIVASAYYTQIAVINGVGDIVVERSVQIGDVRSGPETLCDCCRALLKLVAELELPEDRLAGIGAALAARVDPEKGAVLGAEYLGWEPFSIRETIRSLTEIPFVCDNISNAINRAEVFAGSAQADDTVCLVHAATTIGASFSVHGRILRGAACSAGRIGHLPVAPTERECSCSRRECLNCSGSGWAVLNELGILRSSAYDPAAVLLYAAEIKRLVAASGSEGAGSAAVQEAMFMAGRALAGPLRQVDLLYGPDRIILSGSLTKAPSYVDGVVRSLGDFGSHGEEVGAKVVVSSMTPARAAALVALERFVHSPEFDINRIGGAASGRPSVEASHA